MATTTKLRHSTPSPSDEDFLRFRGQWIVMLIADGTVVAHGDDAASITRNVEAAGYSRSEFLVEFIPIDESLM